MKFEYEPPYVETIDFRALQLIANDSIEGDGYGSVVEDVGSGSDNGRPGGRPGGRE